tara:strand:+ start:1166 stop:1399 length:234 start_codon:yes stop_codon:yes gene_type:complete
LANREKTFEKNKKVPVHKNLEVLITSSLENPDTNRSDKSEIMAIDKVMVFTEILETSGIVLSKKPTEVSPNNPPSPN